MFHTFTMLDGVPSRVHFPFLANHFLLLFLEHYWETLWEPIGKLKQFHENTIKPFENLMGTPKSKKKKKFKNQLWNCP